MASLGWLLNLGFAGGGEAAVEVTVVLGDADLAPIIPEGHNPWAIRRAFENLNLRVENIRNLVLGYIVLNNSGVRIKTDSGVFLRTAAELG